MAGVTAVVRIGSQVLDEVDRHRRAARLHVGRVPSVGDDGERRVRELRRDRAALLDRRVRVEVAGLHEDGDVGDRVALQGRSGARVGRPAEASRSSPDPGPEPCVGGERVECGRVDRRLEEARPCRQTLQRRALAARRFSGA
jgi:hypothetical protein